MEMTPESLRVVTASIRVLRFLGVKILSQYRKKEIDRIVSQVKGETIVEVKREEFALGSEVDIVEGPFADLSGLLIAYDYNNEKTKLLWLVFLAE